MDGSLWLPPFCTPKTGTETGGIGGLYCSYEEFKLKKDLGLFEAKILCSCYLNKPLCLGI